MFSRVKGMNDILPEQMPYWHYVEQSARRVFEGCGFAEVRTPVLEPLELFHHAVGEATDIVQKEMYTLEDRKGRKLAMRPEGTAPVVRALVQHHLDGSDQMHKFYYMASMFRYERPQKGRLRQHHQLGAEIFGTDDPLADAELLTSVDRFLRQLGLKGLKVHINSLGDESCRPEYRQALVNYLKKHENDLSSDSKTRLAINPMRVLDSKEACDQPIIDSAPTMEEYLNDSCKQHLQSVLDYLDQQGIAFEKNPKLVRGLDYYTHTVFEIVAKGIGAQSAVCGGGRYNKLVEQLGGKPTPAIGFGLGLERLILSLQQENIQPPAKKMVWLAYMDEKHKPALLSLAQTLRNANIPCQFIFKAKSLKNQLSRASKLGADYTVILGEDEMKRGQFNLKDMRTSIQKICDLNEVVQTIKEGLA